MYRNYPGLDIVVPLEATDREMTSQSVRPPEGLNPPELLALDEWIERNLCTT
jgi:hypothetical protein